MKEMKLKIRLKFCFAMLVAFAYTGAWCNTETVNGITWTYTIDSGVATIVESRGESPYEPTIPVSTSGALTIPSSLGGCPVEVIGQYAFTGCTNLTMITFPSTVKTIETRALDRCCGLKQVNFAAGLEYLDNSTFRYAKNIICVVFAGNAPTVDAACFKKDSPNFTVIAKPSTTGWDDDGDGCWEGQRIVYKEFTQYPTLDLSRDLKTETVNGVTWTYTINNGVATITEALNVSPYIPTIPQTTSGALIVPSSLGGCPVEIVGSYAFTGCSKLTSITFPSTLKTVETRALDYCTGLKEVYFSAGLEYLDNSTFRFATGITNVIFAGNAPYVDKEKGEGTAVEFREDTPDFTVTVKWGTSGWDDDGDGFWLCRKIVYLDGPNLALSDVSINQNELITDHVDIWFTLTGGSGSARVSVSTKIYEYIGVNAMIKRKAVYSDNVTYNGKPISQCSFPSGRHHLIWHVGEDVGLCMHALCDMNIWAGDNEHEDKYKAQIRVNTDILVETTGGWETNSVTVTDSYNKLGLIGKTGHDGCARLKATFVAGTGVDFRFNWKVSSEKYFDILSYSVDGVQKESISGTDVAWNSVNLSFQDYGRHTVEWEYSRDDSDSEGSNCGWVYDARCYTNSLISASSVVWLTDTVNGSLMITGIKNANSWWGGSRLIVPAKINGISVEKIGDNAFAGLNLTSVYISEGIKYIGNNVFDNCSGLEVISFPYSIQSIGKRQGYWSKALDHIEVFSGERWANTYFAEAPTYFCNCYHKIYSKGLPVEALKYNAAGNVKAYTYYDCYSLTNVIVYWQDSKPPWFTISIEKQAFAYSDNLKDAYIGRGVGEIGEEAFAYCIGLESITIGPDVTNVAVNAFIGCNKLRVILTDAGDSARVKEMLRTSGSGIFVDNVTFVEPSNNIEYRDTKGAENQNPTSVWISAGITFEPLPNIGGWRFVEWLPESIAPGHVGDVVVTANWEWITNSVTFVVGNQGELVDASLSVQKVPYGLNVQLPEVRTYEGWQFEGWRADNKGDEYVTNEVMITNDATFYATWTKLDPIPELQEDATPAQVAKAFDGSVDEKLMMCITNAANYNAYREWAESVKGTNGTETAGAQAVKDSPNAWVSFALGSTKLLEQPPTDEDLTVEAFTPSSEASKFDFTVSVKDVEVGSAAAADNLKKVFGLEGGTTLEPGGLSSDNVNITFGTPENGKVKFTAGPKNANEGTFFMKVKMTP